MEINSIPFDQKEFLRGVFKMLTEKFGEELQFILNHKIDSIDLSLLSFFPTLNTQKDSILIKKFLLRWFKEADTRGLVETSNDQHFSLTIKGFRKAQQVIHPFKYFLKTHWKFVLTVTLSFIAAITAIIRLVRC